MADSLIPLENLAAGFSDPVHDSQATFRVLLDTLARPGTVGTIASNTAPNDALAHVPYAAFAALLTLADYDTPIWLERHDDAFAAAVRFHTGAPLVEQASRAAFAYVHDAASLPAPEAFALGEPETPDRSTTVLIRVESLEGGPSLTLSGPGIQGQTSIAPLGIPDAFWRARAALAPAFPCGIDCYLVCGARVVGIPRTTLVETH